MPKRLIADEGDSVDAMAVSIRVPRNQPSHKSFSPSAFLASIWKKLKIVSEDKLAASTANSNNIYHYSNGGISNNVSASNLEEIDLNDRRSLIPMTELHSTDSNQNHRSPASCSEQNGFATAAPIISGNSPSRPAMSVATGKAATGKVGDGNAELGPRAVSPSVGSVKKGPVTTHKGTPQSITCSRPQALLASLLVVGALLASVLITYMVTKDSVDYRYSHDPKFAAHAGILEPTAAYNGYDDEYRRIAAANREPAAITNNATTELEDEDVDDGPSAAELRLSHDLFPLWYNLSLKIYVPGFVDLPPEKNLTFDAAMILKFRVQKATKVIELNSLKLNFPEDLTQFQILQDGGSAKHRSKRQVGHSEPNSNHPHSDTSLEGPGESQVQQNIDQKTDRVDAGIRVAKVTVNETLEKVFFYLDAELSKDQEYYIKIPYSGPIAKKLSGLYLTQYTTLAGKHKFAAVTQMEPTDARRMAPCFDEPAFKAVWRLRVIHPLGSKAVSNAIELTEDEPTNDPNWILTTFDETLPMSSYLLALVVSDFQYVEGRTNKNTRFRIWARSDAINLTSYALQSGIKVLEFFEDYYGISFPLPKQDMMAFPDFAAGAMENWGLVTYREKYLLYSPDLYTSQQKMAVASVVSHELAHQWFGNLVTMKWWSDLWLNEGFATLMEYLGTDAISSSSFRMDEYFLIEALDNAFDRDSRATSHPLFFEIQKAEDVSEAFDSITYSKGASVLRMIRAVMGEEYFKKGLNIYLNRYKYKNAEHADLWNALTEAVPENLTDWSGNKFDVNEFAKPWTQQMGYPVVEVRRLDEKRIELTQKRFKLDESALEKPKFRNAKYWYKWDVPIWHNVNGTERDMVWLHETTVLDVDEDQVFVLNSESNGFYRVQYSKKTLDRITGQLQNDHERITVKSRARLLDDTFTLAEAGRLPYEAALNLTHYLAHEKEYLPWEMALTGLTVIQNYFGDEPEADHFREYVMHIIGDLFDREINEILGPRVLDSSRFFENLLTARVVQKMCSLRDLKCINKITGIYNNNFVEPCQNGTRMSSDCSTVPVPFRTLTYCEGVHYGSEKDWQMVLDLFQREAVQVERERLMIALACSRDTHTLKKLLAMAADVNNTVIRLQDKPSVFGHVSQRITGQKVIVDFFIDHWPQIYEDFKEQQTLLRSIVQHSIVGNTQRLIDEVEKFISENEKTTKNLDIFKQRLEVIKTNRKWMNKNFRSLSRWFEQQNRLRAGTAMDESASTKKVVVEL
ncbi:peptidase family m1 domain-containing protein [Ditylenchus destructor]|nr:peptidase family m1 domain-containing protein [Ditylenchus destructor]